MIKSEFKEKPIVIIGGGMVGLLLATLLAKTKINTLVIETKKPPLYWKKESLDPRVSAVNAVSQRLLKTSTVWESIRKPMYSPLVRLKVWDNLGGAGITFDGAAVSTPALGAIVENREIVRALWQKCQKDPYIEFICPANPMQLLQSSDFVQLELSNNRKIRTSCVVGADGAHSWLRKQMKIEIKEHAYEQSAVVAVVKTENIHQQTGWQVFLPNAILALLPLADLHHCAIVWSVTTKKADHLMVLDDATFNFELNNAFGLSLGKIQRLTKPKAIPLIMRHAKKYIGPRMVLIGDAAHTMHPLAGQGVNLGFMDAACLAQCFIDDHQKKRDVGSMRVLHRYECWRKGDNAMMLTAICFFKGCFSTQLPFIVQARNFSLNIIDCLSPIKNCLMKIAMGEVGELPDLVGCTPLYDMTTPVLDF